MKARQTWFGYTISGMAGRYTYEQSLGDARRGGSRTALALEEMEAEGYNGTDPSYHVAMLATDLLYESVGAASLIGFWSTLAETNREHSFNVTFGRSVETFYAEFAEYRQRGFS
jgi:hypothetical protein